MENLEQELIKYAEEYHLSITEEQSRLFQKYMELLIEWNDKVNLTAIIKPQEIMIKHFLDSLLLLNAVSLKKSASVIDVGTGAGFPGVPIKICRPDCNLMLLDSLNKRLIFLEELCQQLGIESSFVHSRAEEGGRKKELRARYDLSTARAVAPLNILCEYCLPFVKIGGLFAALKGPEIEQELIDAKNAIKQLGGEVIDCKRYILPDKSGRTIVLIKKRSVTLDIYPRHGSKIAKSPL